MRASTGPVVVTDAQRWQLPDDLPLVERNVVRLVVLDRSGHVLLLRTRDPTYPEVGEWWELPGGGIEPGENHVTAALRELREETGIVATEAHVGPPNWRRHATFRYRGERRLQAEVVVMVQLSAEAPPVDGALRVGFEDEDYFDYRWWPADAIAASVQRFYPGRLPEFLPAFLEGEQVDEPFEIWS